MAHAVTLGLGLAILWLLLSGYFEPLLLAFGVFSVLLTVFIAMRMDVVDHEGVPLQMRLSSLLYFPWLAKEIARASLSVSKIILSPRMDIHQRLVNVRSTQKSDLGKTIFANSITLTPGTVTVECGREGFVVHALNDSFADAEGFAEMDGRVTAIESR